MDAEYPDKGGANHSNASVTMIVYYVIFVESHITSFVVFSDALIAALSYTHLCLLTQICYAEVLSTHAVAYESLRQSMEAVLRKPPMGASVFAQVRTIAQYGTLF